MLKKNLATCAQSYIEKTQQKVNVSCLCGLYGISRQAYYQQLKRNQHVNTKKKQIINMVIQERKVMTRLGTLKLYYLLKLERNVLGIKCGRDKLFGILREERVG